MSVSREYEEYLHDRLSICGEIVSRRMFGGLGLYWRGLFFALAADNTLYFKVDDSNRSDYEEAGMEPFRPFAGKKTTMNFYEVPPDVLDDDKELKKWARRAYAVAVSKRAEKTPPGKKTNGKAGR